MSRLSISEQQGSSFLSDTQRTFNTLVERIAEEREQLASWNAAVTAYQQRYARELQPLLRSYYDIHVELVQWLDQEAAGSMGLSKSMQQTLHEVIASMAHYLAGSVPGDATRAAMQALHARYGPEDRDTDERGKARPQDSTSEEPAIDDPDLDDSPEAILERVEAQMRADQARVEEERQRHRAQRAKKPTERERRDKEAAQQAGQSVRAIYRKLASALHPDREPDPIQRELKTALMQRVNLAYAADNLLDLLQLQLEVQQIDPGQLARLDEERLTHYNQVLSTQLADLQQEVRTTEQSFRADFGLAAHSKLSPQSLEKHLRAQAQQLQADITEWQLQRRALEHPAELKRWLKAQRAAWRQREDG